jgi:hypothetical protein
MNHAWYCRFTWYPGTTTDKVRVRVTSSTRLARTGRRRFGWYNLAGGGAGFLLIDAGDPEN